MNKTRFNPRCYIGMEWSGGDDDDPNEVQLDDGDDGDDFPGRFLLAGELFSLTSFRPVEVAEYFLDGSPCLRDFGG